MGKGEIDLSGDPELLAMSSHFYNPVKITFAESLAEGLIPLLKGRRVSVLTTKGMIQRKMVEPIKEVLAERNAGVCAEVVSNPDVESILRCVQKVSSFDSQVIVAMGGGSVLDTAKVVAVLLQSQLPQRWLQEFLDGHASLSQDINSLPVIAIPTTSGTGSEVTKWSAIWDKEIGQKYSLSHQKMYPEAALLIPALTETLSYEDTLFPALDAFSQSMEAIWNRNANPVSDALAMQVISSLFEVFKNNFCDSFVEPSVRKKLQRSSLLAGLAFSNTETAIAHSLSYPLTGKKGMPHGLACSFALAEILRFNYQGSPERVGPVLKALGCSDVEEGVESLYGIFEDLNISMYIQRTIAHETELQYLGGSFVSSQRAGNNIVPFSNETALELLSVAFRRLLKGAGSCK